MVLYMRTEFSKHYLYSINTDFAVSSLDAVTFPRIVNRLLKPHHADFNFETGEIFVDHRYIDELDNVFCREGIYTLLTDLYRAIHRISEITITFSPSKNSIGERVC